jgi:hypothetical protein
MSWAIGYDSNWNRDIGYGVPSRCDHLNCGKSIDRGLAHVCGGEPYGGEEGCGLYFCAEHLSGFPQLCERCQRGKKAFKPTLDTEEWIHHKETDPSWEKWRNDRKV